MYRRTLRLFQYLQNKSSEKLQDLLQAIKDKKTDKIKDLLDKDATELLIVVDDGDTSKEASIFSHLKSSLKLVAFLRAPLYSS